MVTWSRDQSQSQGYIAGVKSKTISSKSSAHLATLTTKQKAYLRRLQGIKSRHSEDKPVKPYTAEVRQVRAEKLSELPRREGYVVRGFGRRKWGF
jgi:hypothetical protein